MKLTSSVLCFSLFFGGLTAQEEIIKLKSELGIALLKECIKGLTNPQYSKSQKLNILKQAALLELNMASFITKRIEFNGLKDELQAFSRYPSSQDILNKENAGQAQWLLLLTSQKLSINNAKIDSVLQKSLNDAFKMINFFLADIGFVDKKTDDLSDRIAQQIRLLFEHLDLVMVKKI